MQVQANKPVIHPARQWLCNDKSTPSEGLPRLAVTSCPCHTPGILAQPWLPVYSRVSWKGRLLTPAYFFTFYSVFIRFSLVSSPTTSLKLFLLRYVFGLDDLVTGHRTPNGINSKLKGKVIIKTESISPSPRMKSHHTSASTGTASRSLTMAVDNSFWVASPQFVSWIPSSLRTFSIGPKRIGYQFVPRPVVASVWGHPVRSPRISHGNHVVRTRGGRGRAQEKRRSQKCGRYQADEVMRVLYDSPLGFH